MSLGKFIRLRVETGYAIGIAHDFGRIERILLTANAPLVNRDDTGLEWSAAVAQRTADALNACAELSDGTLALMAKGGTHYGSLAERVALAALLWGENGRLAERLLARARKEIAKAGGKI